MRAPASQKPDDCDYDEVERNGGVDAKEEDERYEARRLEASNNIGGGGIHGWRSLDVDGVAAALDGDVERILEQAKECSLLLRCCLGSGRSQSAIDAIRVGLERPELRRQLG